MNASSSSPSKEDVPLKQRKKAKKLAVTKKAKKETRKKPDIFQPVQNVKSKKFVIPRNKKTRELLDVQGLETRDAVELLRKVKQSFYQPDIISAYVFENVTIIHNARFNTEFSAKKQEMRQDGYAPKDLEDTFAYLHLDNWHKVKKVAKEGLQVESSYFSTLGDPKMGIYMSRFPDLVLPYAIPPRSSKFLMVFKIVKGKLKAVSERTGDGCPLEPTPNYDGHISKCFPPAHNVSSEQAFISSQFYFYEFSDDGDDLHARRPRQCCPYAVIQYSVTTNQSHHFSSRNVLTQGSSLRNLPAHDLARNVSGQALPSRNEKNNNDRTPLMNAKPMFDGRMYASYSKHGRTLWSGVIKNKETILSSADLICYSSDILPITIGGHIDIKAKVSCDKLKSLYPSPIFKELPAISTKCKAFNQRTMFLYCEVRPREKNVKLDKLIKFFQKKSLVGVAEFPESHTHIYVIPTSQLSHHLGITDRYYPNMLHALILKKLPKEDVQSYKKMSKMAADPVAEAAVRRDIRKELRRIEIEKLKKRGQSDDATSRGSSDSTCQVPSDMEVSGDVAENLPKKTDGKTEVAEDKDAVDTAAKRDGSESAAEITGDAMETMQTVALSEEPDKEYQGTNVASAVNESVEETAIPQASDTILKDMQNTPHTNNEGKIPNDESIFKSPPRIQKLATVSNETFLSKIPRTNTVTRHFMDPRLGWKADRFIVSSPTEVEAVSSDSGAETPEQSPVVPGSRTNNMSTYVTPQPKSVLQEGDTEGSTQATGVNIDNTGGHKDKVAQLSSRLTALFSQLTKQSTKAAVSSVISPRTPTTSTDMVSFSVASENVVTISPATTSIDEQQTNTTSSSPPVPSPLISLASALLKLSYLRSSSRGQSVATSSQGSSVPSHQPAITNLGFSSNSCTTASNVHSTETFSNSLNNDSKIEPYSSFKTLPEVSSIPTTGSSVHTATSSSLVVSSVYTASNLGTVNLSSSSSHTGTAAFSSAATSLNPRTETSTQCHNTPSQLSSTVSSMPGKVNTLPSSDRRDDPVTNTPHTTVYTPEWTVPTVHLKKSDTPPICVQSPVFTSSSYPRDVISLHHTSETMSPSTKSVMSLESPSTSSSPASSANVSDNGGALEFKSEEVSSHTPQMLNFTSTSTSSDISSRNDRNICEGGQRNDGNLPQEFPQRNDAGKLQTRDNDAAMEVETQQCSDTTDGYGTVDKHSCNDHVQGLGISSQTPVTRASCEAHNTGTSHTPPAASTPPLPTVPLPPPPPPPLTTSYSAGYTSTQTSSWNTGRGVHTHVKSHSKDGTIPVVEAASQDSCDLYAYALTLSSGDTTDQDGSNSCAQDICGDEMFVDTFHHRPPVMQDNQIRTVYSSLPFGQSHYRHASPLPPPPPPMPVYPSQPLYHPTPPVFSQRMYPMPYLPYYAHPYPIIRPTQYRIPTMSKYQYPLPANTEYTNLSSPVPRDFNTTSGFGYTKQNPNLWNENAVASDEEQSLASGDKEQRKHSSCVAQMPSEKVVEIRRASNLAKSSSSYLNSRRDAATFLRSGEKEREFSTSRERRSSSSSEHSKESSDRTGEMSRREESRRSQSSEDEADRSGDHSEHDSKRSPAKSKKITASQSPRCEDGDLNKKTDSSDFGGVYLSALFLKAEERKEKDVTECGLMRTSEREDFSNRRQSSERRSTEKCSSDDSGTEGVLSAFESLDEDSANDEKQDDTRDLGAEREGSDISSVGSEEKREQWKGGKDHISSNSFNVNQGWLGTFSELSYVNRGCVEDPSRQKACDNVPTMQGIDSGRRSSPLDMEANDGVKFLDSNESLAEIQVTDKEAPSSLAYEKSKWPGDNEMTEPISDDDDDVRSFNGSDWVSVKTLSEYVDSNDDDIEVLMSEEERGMSSDFDDGEGKNCSGEICGDEREVNTGRKREKISDLREVLRTKKQKLADDDSQMNVAHSRRVVEILRGDAADSEGEDSTPSGRMVNETTVVTSERIHVVLENRRKLNSPYSESRVSTPDRSRTPDEPRRKLPSPEYKKRRRLPSPESERRARSPGRKRHEHPTEYSISRAGSSAGSWAISDMKHSTRKRSRIENESPSFSKDYSTEMPTGSRRERQRTISPSESHYSSVSERDSFQASARISPDRESRSRSKYGVRKYDVRSSGSDSSCKRSGRRDSNNNWPRHIKSWDMDSRRKSDIDFTDKNFLSRLATPDNIERLKHYVHGNLQDTLDENPQCLDEPDQEYSGKKQPFFGGIGEYIYAKRDEEDFKNLESLQEESYRSLSPRPKRKGTSGDYHGEGRRDSRSKNRYEFSQVWL